LALVILNLTFLIYATHQQSSFCVQADDTEDRDIIPDQEDLLLITSKHNYSDLALGIKTGKDVAFTRTLIQLVTFLQDVEHFLFFTEAPHIQIGSHKAIDVISNLYSSRVCLTRTRQGRSLCRW
jgi:hypothetical protein